MFAHVFEASHMRATLFRLPSYPANVSPESNSQNGAPNFIVLMKFRYYLICHKAHTPTIISTRICFYAPIHKMVSFLFAVSLLKNSRQKLPDFAQTQRRSIRVCVLESFSSIAQWLHHTLTLTEESKKT